MMTYNQYVELPDDGNRYEIVDGVLEMMSPAPSLRHQKILTRLTSAFDVPCREEGVFFVAPVDVIFAVDNVRQPDFLFVLNENLHILSERAVEGVPDLVGEILSSSSAKIDKKTKFETYQRFGVKEYWIINPELELLEQFILKDGQYILFHVYSKSEVVRTPLMNCLSVSMDDIMG
jgi:Uma2 family endonuclease